MLLYLFSKVLIILLKDKRIGTQDEYMIVLFLKIDFFVWFVMSAQILATAKVLQNAHIIYEHFL